jgi:UDP-glucose 4-epimerase
LIDFGTISALATRRVFLKIYGGLLMHYLRASNILLVGGCGYIGSYLYPLLTRAGYKVTVVDIIDRGNPGRIPVIRQDYASLSKEFLSSFGTVLWFAGHSSVSKCILEPADGIINNCINLFSMAQKIPADTKFIYASSGSVYSASLNKKEISFFSEKTLLCPPEFNAYDMSKYALDYLLKNLNGNHCGLRMGTLAGYSANLRQDLVFNAMNISALNDGFINLSNPRNHRTILFLNDLGQLLLRLIEAENIPKLINAGSLNLSINTLARRLGEIWSVPILQSEDTNPYSFGMDLGLISKFVGKLANFDDEAIKFASEYCQFDKESFA